MDFWVSYKLIGGFALTLLYVVLTMAYLAHKGFLTEHGSAAEAADAKEGRG
jgi:intracellular septation protein A